MMKFIYVNSESALIINQIRYTRIRFVPIHRNHILFNIFKNIYIVSYNRLPGLAALYNKQG